jgi:hypothetical protein
MVGVNEAVKVGETISTVEVSAGGGELVPSGMDCVRFAITVSAAAVRIASASGIKTSGIEQASPAQNSNKNNKR